MLGKAGHGPFRGRVEDDTTCYNGPTSDFAQDELIAHRHRYIGIKLQQSRAQALNSLFVDWTNVDRPRSTPEMKVKGASIGDLSFETADGLQIR